MTKKIKKEALEVGQKVFLETIGRHGNDIRGEEKPEELIVLEANKTSAYIWYNDQSKVRYKVNQKTHEVKYAIPNGRYYRLWLSLEEYEAFIAYEQELHSLREQAHKAVDSMNIEELRTLINTN